MVFGEIVEPSTRALIDDDYEEYPEYAEPTLNWENVQTVPSNIESLLIIESERITKLFRVFVISHAKPITTLNNGLLQIYQEPNDVFLITYNKSELSTGQITETLKDWIKQAKQIYTITSESIATYQNIELQEKPETLIRTVANHSEGLKYAKLEPPNLVTGLSASVLTYCVHTGLKCTLFIVYMDNSPLDSVNTELVIELMNSLKLCVKSNSLNSVNSPASNLYL